MPVNEYENQMVEILLSNLLTFRRICLVEKEYLETKIHPDIEMDFSTCLKKGYEPEIKLDLIDELNKKKECIEFALKQGYEIDKVFIEEGESAKDLNRTQLKAMFEYCTQKYKDVDALIFWKWDRLSRGEQSDYLELGKFFDKNNIKPLSVTENNEETAEAELLRWINQGTSRYEWRKIQERTKLGMRGAVEQGRWVNLAPVGYKNDKEKSLIPCPVNAKYIKMAFELFATGLYSQTELIDKLRIAGMEKLDKNKIGRILRNKVYIGLLT